MIQLCIKTIGREKYLLTEYQVTAGFYILPFSFILLIFIVSPLFLLTKQQSKKWKQKVTVSADLPFTYLRVEGFPGGSGSKESTCNAGHPGSFRESGRSPGEGNGNPLSILAWRISWTEKPGGLQSMGSQKVRHDFIFPSLH